MQRISRLIDLSQSPPAGRKAPGPVGWKISSVGEVRVPNTRPEHLGSSLYNWQVTGKMLKQHLSKNVFFPPGMG